MELTLENECLLTPCGGVIWPTGLMGVAAALLCVA